MIATDLASIAADFDAFLIDQFGVLLDGKAAFAPAPASLQRLAKLGKPILLLSNSGKRAEPNAKRLVSLGFARDSFDMVLSSGEAAYHLLARRIGSDLPHPTKIWLHARDEDDSGIRGLDAQRVMQPEAADLLLLAGSQADSLSMASYQRLLAAAAAARVPMLCSNPDMTMLTPRGLRPGAGAIATAYAKMGGPVEWIGKPYPLIYAEAAARLPGCAPARVLCIGDSPAHDILGGQRAGHATALVRSGLHADLTDAALAALCAQTARPDFVIPAFDLSQDAAWL
ncbi:TIGR01459 family HAD-type hydrolase [Cypionkella sp.]|jgi:HAD superfamily hydrolase (TIGR01459 family)|nr:TIGR01459 family HAD-type hydrolase [Cypionkella sp.]